MDQKKIIKICSLILGIYLIIAVGFYWIGGDQLRFREAHTDMVTNSGNVEEITSDMVLEQKIAVPGSRLSAISFMAGTYTRENSGILQLEICSLDGKTLAVQTVELNSLKDNAIFLVQFPNAVELPENKVLMRITAPQSEPGNAVTLYTGNTVSTGRHELNMTISEEERLSINGDVRNDVLCSQIYAQEVLFFGEYYWVFAITVFILLGAVLLNTILRNKKGKHTVLLKAFSVWERYRYLMKQLVQRDFKTKYKRSVLGMFWSFLNPLLTMMVQYVIFSTLFKSDIPNFAVYLLTGIVCYSFFNEATTMALGSIVGNAPLITKVYVPKYIYPLTRVISSLINFLLALIPLVMVLLVTRTPIRPAILLLPFGVLCLFMLSLGIGLILATAMVFFRDMQFLWGVLCMMWMYATPIFYPISIIPPAFMTLFKCNPLYHVIRFIRIILIDGVSPEPKAYLFCILTTLIPLLIGLFVFKRHQNEFVLNL